jgi:YHS domain-containing protein
MTRMIDQILDFARIRSGQSFALQLESADLRQVCQSVIDELRLSRPDQEIALSILAEIIETRRRREPEPARTPITLEIYTPVEAIDPICGMRVDVAGARFTSEFEGTVYYFCCQGCKMTFEREPLKYAVGRQD